MISSNHIIIRIQNQVFVLESVLLTIALYCLTTKSDKGIPGRENSPKGHDFWYGVSVGNDSV